MAIQVLCHICGLVLVLCDRGGDEFQASQQAGANDHFFEPVSNIYILNELRCYAPSTVCPLSSAAQGVVKFFAVGEEVPGFSVPEGLGSVKRVGSSASTERSGELYLPLGLRLPPARALFSAALAV
jgi:hypothetical protein